MPNPLPNVSAYLDGMILAVSEDKLAAMAPLFASITAEGLAPIVADSGDWDAHHREPVTITEKGIAVIPVSGVLAKRANMSTTMSGGTSTDVLGAALHTAADDPKVRGIMLRMDTPGGEAYGIKGASRAIDYAQSKKPLVAFADGDALSGGMWLGATAKKFVASEDARLGSIGVIASRMDISGAMEKAGIKQHFFREGDYKALGQQSEGLTKRESEDMARQLGRMKSAFVKHIAERRNISEEAVYDTEARVYDSEEALSLNLIDAQMNYDEVLATLDADASAEEKILALKAELSERDSVLASATADATTAAEALAALQATNATLEASAKATKISAAVKQFTEDECKVGIDATSVAALTDRLTVDYDGTVAALALVPANAAAPKSAPALAALAGDGIDESDVLTKARAAGLPVAPSKGAASVFESARVAFIDESGDAAVVRNFSS